MGVVESKKFRKNIERAAKENLTQEQKQERALEFIGIPMDILRLPGVKDVLFSLEGFQQIRGGGVFFEERAQNVRRTYRVQSDGGKITHNYKVEDDRETGGSFKVIYEENCLGMIKRESFEISQGAEGGYTIRKEDICVFPSKVKSEDRKYDKNNVEVYRKYTEFLDGTIQEIREVRRDVNQIEKIARAIKLPQQTGEVTMFYDDISYIVEKDIATLDAADVITDEMLSSKTMFDRLENPEIKTKRLDDAIARSKNRRGCLAFLGIAEAKQQD